MVGLIGTAKGGLTVASVAHIKGISLSTVYRWVRKNPSPTTRRNGRRIFIDPVALDSIPGRNTRRSSVHSDAEVDRLKDSSPGNVDSSTEQSAAGDNRDSAPQPVPNQSCGQRELGHPSRSHFGTGLAVFFVPQFIG